MRQEAGESMFMGLWSRLRLVKPAGRGPFLQ